MISSETPICDRFRIAQEKTRLSPEVFGSKVGLSSASVWDIETIDYELELAYDLADLEGFASALTVPVDYFFPLAEPPLSLVGFAELIRKHCQQHELSVDAFTDITGRRLAPALEEPERFRTECSLDGLQEICRCLDCDWRQLQHNFGREVGTIS